ncbi:hypothetical protein PUR21_25305 [Methylorubrum rhodesianum]|uniref:Uncharacterized protein n=1 Tax=Methylorubrum rhodesianum TaxID=29427 RepID=A0ABU9ZJ59_9HYPH|nr:hypothetical protein [Methylorubrum rhodesianum]
MPAHKGRGLAMASCRGERSRFGAPQQLDEVPGSGGNTDGTAGQASVAQGWFVRGAMSKAESSRKFRIFPDII